MDFLVGKCGASVGTCYDSAMRTVSCQMCHGTQKDEPKADVCCGCPYNTQAA